ncbi:hypothetical protein GA0115260_115241, partial [Streptomyces sp. MnatMP-M27]
GGDAVDGIVELPPTNTSAGGDGGVGGPGGNTPGSAGSAGTAGGNGYLVFFW